MKPAYYRIIGGIFWAVVCLAAIVSSGALWQEDHESQNVSLVGYLFGRSTSVLFDDPSAHVRVGDPLFIRDNSSEWKQIGYVSNTQPADTGHRVTIDWYSTQFSPDDCQLSAYHNRGSLEDVIATMLPPEKRQQIRQRLAAAMTLHGDDLSNAFVPLAQESLRRSLPVIEEELRRSIVAHRDEINALADRWNDEIVEGRLIPLARQEIVPIVREHGQGPAEEIGRELWDRASLWRFGWRAAYDNTPLPKRDLVREEWRRFVEDEAVPVVESRMDDIVIAVQRIISDIASNDAIRSELATVTEELITDPETQQLVQRILKETLLESERLRDVWREVWSSAEARRAIDMAGDRLEPMVRQIGDDLFGTKETGIDPNFARVLRNQILGKDRRWLVADVTDAPNKEIRPASSTMVYPIVHMASPEVTAER